MIYLYYICELFDYKPSKTDIMAIVQNPITGRSKNKFGNAVFSTQFGQNTLRTKAITVKNPRTENQLAVRAHMKRLVSIFKQINPEIKEAYGSSVKGMSPFNRVISINMKCAFPTSGIGISAESLVICDNVGLHPDSFVLACNVADQVHVTYVPHNRTPEEGLAQMFFFAYNSTTDKMWKIPDSNCNFELGLIDLHIPNQSNQTLAIYSSSPDCLRPLDGKPRQIFTYCGYAMMI